MQIVRPVSRLGQGGRDHEGQNDLSFKVMYKQLVEDLPLTSNTRCFKGFDFRREV